MSGGDARIAALYQAACLAELQALKPGNVHRFADGHRMAMQDFIASAEASAPHIAQEGAPVGARILAGVAATRRAVGQNTNLGILLLCAPLAAAAQARQDRSSLREALGAVLAGLTQEDAVLTFEAIALAAPGGLGRAPEADVRDAPPIGLVAAMRLARHRDMLAAQYAGGFSNIFELGVPLAAGRPMAQAAEAVFLAFASAFPDSHVARKHGEAVATNLMHDFARLARSLPAGAQARHAALLGFDRQLKARGLNPGTSADLTVASLFAAGLA